MYIHYTIYSVPFVTLSSRDWDLAPPAIPAPICTIAKREMKTPY